MKRMHFSRPILFNISSFQSPDERSGLRVQSKGQAFKLTHSNAISLLLYCENDNTSQKWLEALSEAVQVPF